MRPNPLHRVVAPLNLGDHSIQYITVKKSPIPNLSARLRVKRRVIKNDLALLPSLEPLHPLPIANNGQHFTVLRPRLPIPLKLRFGKLLISRVGSLFGRALPRGASTFTLFGHRTVEAAVIEPNAEVPAEILDEVLGYPVGVIHLEGFDTRKFQRNR